MEFTQSGQPITPTLINTLAEIKTQGGDWKKVAEEHTLNSTSKVLSASVTIDYSLTWVRPGVHALTPEDIINQRRCMLDDAKFINLMTPYFARHKAIRDGMLELHTLFFGHEEQGKDGYYHRRTPTQPVTYDQMLSILRNICDGIDHTQDPYPNKQFCLNARDRYRCYLKSGNHMPLMAEEEEEVTSVESNNLKRMAHDSHPHDLQRDSKRRRVADEAGIDC